MTEADLIEGAARKLEQLGIGLAVRTRLQPLGKGREVDAVLTVARGKARHAFVLEARRTVGPATLGAALAHLDQAQQAAGLPGLLVTEYVTPPMGERLRELGRGFLDLAGNCHLETPDFLVHVVGRKPEVELTVVRPGKAFTPAGLRLLFALICDPDLAQAPQRALAAAADVALGTVPAVLADLRQSGRLLVAGKRRRLNANKRLLDEWALGYAQQLRPKLLRAVYDAPTFDAWQTWDLGAPELRWGGEPAANRLAGYLQPGVLTLYGDKLPPRLMIEQRLKPATQAGGAHTVELRKPFWGRELNYQGRTDTVAPALVYADLLATGEARSLEMAERLYDEHLARLFPAG